MHPYFEAAIFFVLAISLALCLIRIIRGPTAFDRVIGFDCLALNTVGAIVLASIQLDTTIYLDSVLVVTLLGFLGTISLATYLREKEYD